MAIGGEVFERIGAGGPRAGLGLLDADVGAEAHLAEEYVADLLRAAEVEGLARKLLRLGLERAHALGEFAGEFREPVAIDQHAGALHVGDDRDERTILRFVDGRRRLLARRAASGVATGAA